MTSLKMESLAPPGMLRHAPRGHIAARCRDGSRTRRLVTHASTQPVQHRQSCYWRWPRIEADVHYERAGDSGPAVVLLPGFGVGTFHYSNQLEELPRRGYTCYALDYLGQGRSWPQDATGLQFSVDLWAQQVIDFIEHVVLPQSPGAMPFLAGNSLGGFIATYVAALRPDLVRGLLLLNATPFWSSAPNPETEPQLASRMPWNGTLPAPWYLRFIVGLWWNTLRLPSTVRSIMGLVYTDRRALTDALVEDILTPTRRAQAADVFVSIFLSPKAPLRFDDMLDMRTCPVCLVYGAEDPWVVPLWGQRLKRRVPDATYYELSPAGHCPHHERPQAVNELMAAWMSNQVSGTPELLPDTGDAWELPLDDGSGAMLRVTRTDGSPRNPFEVADAQAAAMSADGRTGTQAGAVSLLKKLTGKR